MWYFVVFQPSKCKKTHFQPQIWSIWPIFPKDSESLPKFCYIKRKNSEILSKLRNSEPVEVSASSSLSLLFLGVKLTLDMHEDSDKVRFLDPVETTCLPREAQIGSISLFQVRQPVSGFPLPGGGSTTAPGPSGRWGGRSCWWLISSPCTAPWPTIAISHPSKWISSSWRPRIVLTRDCLLLVPWQSLACKEGNEQRHKLH